MEKSFQATIEKVAKISGELIWARTAAVLVTAELVLIVSQLFDINSTLESLDHRLTALEGGQQQIFAVLQQLDNE